MKIQPILPAGVMLFLVWRDSFHLILRDNKPEISLPNTWSPVTGGVKKDETYIQAMLRELKDETGLTTVDVIPIGVSKKPNGFFFGRINDAQKESIILGEGQKFRFFRFNEIPEDAKGAFRIYLDKYPEVFRRMCEDENFVPKAEDLNLDY